MMTSKTDGEVNEGQNLVIIYIDTTGCLKRLSRCLLTFSLIEEIPYLKYAENIFIHNLMSLDND